MAPSSSGEALAPAQGEETLAPAQGNTAAAQAEAAALDLVANGLAPVSERRVANDGQAYSFTEFCDYYGRRTALQRWRSAGVYFRDIPAPSPLDRDGTHIMWVDPPCPNCESPFDPEEGYPDRCDLCGSSWRTNFFRALGRWHDMVGHLVWQMREAEFEEVRSWIVSAKRLYAALHQPQDQAGYYRMREQLCWFSRS